MQYPEWILLNREIVVGRAAIAAATARMTPCHEPENDDVHRVHRDRDRICLVCSTRGVATFPKIPLRVGGLHFATAQQ
jgi:hypothetical protein